MESSSDRLVHWKRKPRSRIVCRKGDVREARAFSSSAAEVSSSVDDVDGASASAVDNRREVVCVLLNFTVGVVGLCKLKLRDDDDDDAQVAATRRRLLLRKDER